MRDLEDISQPHNLVLFVTPGGGKPMGLAVNDARTRLAIADHEAPLSTPHRPGKTV